MILEKLQFSHPGDGRILTLRSLHRHWFDLIPDNTRSVTANLRMSRPRDIRWCIGSHLNVSEIGVSGLIFYAVDEAGASLDTTKQMTSFAAGALPEFVHINVCDRPVTCHERHTRITTPIIKEMLAVWQHSHTGKVEAPIDSAGQVKICLCLGVPLDIENGEGIYLIADKSLKLNDEQKRLRLKYRRKLKSLEKLLLTHQKLCCE